MNPYWLTCSSCGHRDFVRPPVLLMRMQRLGMLRRLSDPDPVLIDELLPSAMARMQCDLCQRVGLSAEQADDDDAEWDQVRSCEACGGTIPTERLEIFPDSRRCAKCEQRAASIDTEEQEYCPRCGTPMRLKSGSRGGISRYQYQCPSCGQR